MRTKNFKSYILILACKLSQLFGCFTLFKVHAESLEIQIVNLDSFGAYRDSQRALKKRDTESSFRKYAGRGDAISDIKGLHQL